MTATLGDAPDWQGYSQWRASQGTVIDETISIGNPFTSKVVVTNWASFNLYAVLNSGTGFTIIVTWYNDADYTQAADTQVWVLNDSSILNVTLPCLTPYAQIEFTTGESGNQTITSYFTPQNLAVTKATYLSEGNVVSELGVTLEASDVATYQVPYVMTGPASVSLVPYDASGKLLLSVNYYGENGDQLAACYQSFAPDVESQGVSGLFYTPAYPVKLVVTNTDASASHEFELAYQGLSQ